MSNPVVCAGCAAVPNKIREILAKLMAARERDNWPLVDGAVDELRRLVKFAEVKP
jgi:hypothetical protein